MGVGSCVLDENIEQGLSNFAYKKWFVVESKKESAFLDSSSDISLDLQEIVQGEICENGRNFVTIGKDIQYINPIFKVYSTLQSIYHGKPCQYSCLENSMDRGAW